MVFPFLIGFRISWQMKNFIFLQVTSEFIKWRCNELTSVDKRYLSNNERNAIKDKKYNWKTDSPNNKSSSMINLIWSLAYMITAKMTFTFFNIFTVNFEQVKRLWRSAKIHLTWFFISYGLYRCWRIWISTTSYGKDLSFGKLASFESIFLLK